MSPQFDVFAVTVSDMARANVLIRRRVWCVIRPGGISRRAGLSAERSDEAVDVVAVRPPTARCP